MSVRQRRLEADFALVRACFAGHPHIRLVETEGDPPERYRIEYRLNSLVIQAGKVVEKDRQLVEIFLTLGYPRQAPQCRMLTPVFHPNIAPHAVCIGDHWSAGESLAALIARIGEMITYQSYNVKSPLNGEAARWAAENVGRLPVQAVDLTVDLAAARRAVTEDRAGLPATPNPGTSPSSAPDSATALEAATTAMRAGNAAEAIRLLDAATATSPGDAEAWRLKAVARSMRGDRTGAARDFEVVLRLCPGHERADWMHRFVAETLGRPPQV